MDNIPDLISDRVELYAEIARKKNDSEAYIKLLSELLRRTKWNALPQKYESKAYLTIDKDDIVGDSIILKMALATFIKHMLPAQYQMLENFFSLVNKGQ